MKKTAAAGLALAASSSLALAQGSVTIFGTADLYLAHAKSGPSSSTRLEDGGQTASRLGFRGAEDLGGGFDAHFTLEAGFAPDTGKGTLAGPEIAFTRQSFVGLSTPWGQVDAGRMYTPMFYTLFKADPYGVNSVFSPINLVAATDAQPGLLPFAARASNMVRYRTPAIAGFYADLAYAPGEASAASHDSSSPRAHTARAARSHSGAATVPSIASGVITSVTQGIATRLATSPTSDTCWNSSRLRGVSASVIVHCSRSSRHSRARRPGRVSPGSPASVANSTPTATKLSQKPACVRAQGSSATTTAAVSSQPCGQGQRRPVRRSSATVASIQTVRCDGTPQPLNSA